MKRVNQYLNRKLPFFSVIIPTYNSELTISETLITVFSQTYKNYEVIVSDDGSSDGTKNEVEGIFNKFPQIKAKLISNSHAGAGAARNSGIKISKGNWVAFLDSDDRWFREKLEMVAEYIHINENIDLVSHNEILIKNDNRKLLRHIDDFNNRIHPFLSLFRVNALSTSAVTVKKELLMNVGLFDTTLPIAQDYDLWLRLSLLPDFKIGYIEKPLGFYFVGDKNISSNYMQILYDVLKICEKNVENIKKLSTIPNIEINKFVGKAYAMAGLRSIRAKELKTGIDMLIVGIFKWPFIYSLTYRLIKSLK